MKFKTMSVHSGQRIDPQTGALTTPLYQSSTFSYFNAQAGKERFAKELLFDASAFKSLLDRLGKLRVGVQMAFTPEEQLAETKLYLGPMQKDLAKANEIASDKGKVLVGEVGAAIAGRPALGSR